MANENITPDFDYLLCKEVKEESGAVTGSDISDHWQKFEVLAAGKGRYDHGIFISVTKKVGDIIHVQKHAEADTPQELKARGLFLIMASRVMATEK